MIPGMKCMVCQKDIEPGALVAMHRDWERPSAMRSVHQACTLPIDPTTLRPGQRVLVQIKGWFDSKYIGEVTAERDEDWPVVRVFGAPEVLVRMVESFERRGQTVVLHGMGERIAPEGSVLASAIRLQETGVAVARSDRPLLLRKDDYLAWFTAEVLAPRPE